MIEKRGHSAGVQAVKESGERAAREEKWLAEAGAAAQRAAAEKAAAEKAKRAKAIADLEASWQAQLAAKAAARQAEEAEAMQYVEEVCNLHSCRLWCRTLACHACLWLDVCVRTCSQAFSVSSILHNLRKLLGARLK